MKKVLIHEAGVGFQPMRLLVLCCLGTREGERVDSYSVGASSQKAFHGVMWTLAQGT